MRVKLDRVKRNRENVCTKRMKAKVVGDDLDKEKATESLPYMYCWRGPFDGCEVVFGRR